MVSAHPVRLRRQVSASDNGPMNSSSLPRYSPLSAPSQPSGSGQPIDLQPLAGVRVAVETMGCRVNRYDAAQLRAELASLGCEVVPAESAHQLYVLNTCTVTHQADSEARRLARRAKRRQPDTQVVMTGCYAEVSPADLAAMPEVDLVVGNQHKMALAQRLVGLINGQPDSAPQVQAAGQWGSGLMFGGDGPLADLAGDSRFFLKVQEGCDIGCAFCIIPTARGQARSMPLADVITTVQRAVAAGYHEVILAGIHLGGYGQDLDDPDIPDFVTLLQQVLAHTDVQRLRFGSLEPWGLTPELVALFADSERLLPSLHLPLQSGSASVLKRMRRPCTPAYYQDQVSALLMARPDLYLSTDILTGFPGETETEFDEGFDFIRSLPFAHLHVFPYSRRDNTPAAQALEAAHDGFAEVPDPVKKQRVQRLIELSEQQQQAALMRQIGVQTEVLIEHPGRGHSHHNYKVSIPSRPDLASGTLVTVEIDHVQDGSLIGVPL